MKKKLTGTTKKGRVSRESEHWQRAQHSSRDYVDERRDAQGNTDTFERVRGSGRVSKQHYFSFASFPIRRCL